MAARFRHFLAIDWSGAQGQFHKGIALALADAAGGPPVLLRRERPWSRGEVLEYLRRDLPPDTLVGMDLGISLPFADRGAFFPGWERSPPDARSLWHLVETICAQDLHLAANSLVDHAEASRHFRRHGGREGDLFGGGRGRFRVTELHQRRQGCQPYSNFNLVGAAQVGKASLTGMRLLHRLEGALPVWPIDKLPPRGSAIVEIYTAIAAIAALRSPAKSKIRTYENLALALGHLGSEAVPGSGAIDDHASDALLAAAWLRTNAHRPDLWHPEALAPAIARTEGWTFGVG